MTLILRRMKHLARLAWLWPFVALPLFAADPVVRFVDFETTVNPVTANRIVRAIDEAEAGGEDLVLIRLDTPGGLVASMEKIVKRMLASKVPVVVWVGPSGAKAASAGFFILIAGDVAANPPSPEPSGAARKKPRTTIGIR